MLLSRWHPLIEREFQRLQNEMGRFLNEVVPIAASPAAMVAGYPAVNLWADEDSLYLEAELPGITEDLLQITVSEGNKLTIEGERHAPDPKQGAWHHQERGFGKFRRVLELPVNIDADKVQAKLEHGVLRLTLPKAPEVKPRRITVHSGQ